MLQPDSTCLGLPGLSSVSPLGIHFLARPKLLLHCCLYPLQPEMYEPESLPGITMFYGQTWYQNKGLKRKGLSVFIQITTEAVLAGR